MHQAGNTKMSDNYKRKTSIKDKKETGTINYFTYIVDTVVYRPFKQLTFFAACMRQSAQRWPKKSLKHERNKCLVFCVYGLILSVSVC